MKSSFYASHLARGARALHGARAHTDRQRARTEFRAQNESKTTNISKRNRFILNLPSTAKFNENKIFETLKIYKNFFSSFYSKKILKTPKHKNLVFLVGFPRSGTTLLDTILRSHSKTLVLEEKPYLWHKLTMNIPL